MSDFNEQVERLLENDRLVKWVLAPDEEVIAYWEKWMQENPDGIAALYKAREIAHDLANTQHPADTRALADSIWLGINEKIDQSTTKQVSTGQLADTQLSADRAVPMSAGNRRSSLVWLTAAALTGSMILTAALFYYKHHTSALPQQKVANFLVKQDIDRVNQTDQSQIVYLVDGSKVTLLPGAGIRHAAFLQKDKREVYLEGDAFFEIAKDSRRPFYVYSGDLVVHVLGTSFKVSNNKQNGDVTILVRTGKVAVSSKNKDTDPPMILVSNQKALYKGLTRDLTQVAEDKRDQLPDPMPAAFTFDFDDAPVVRIFQTLELAYGIPFHYDEKAYAHCTVTTNLGDEPLEEKVKIVCAAIGVKYDIRDNGVFLEGKPCQ